MVFLMEGQDPVEGKNVPLETCPSFTTNIGYLEEKEYGSTRCLSIMRMSGLMATRSSYMHYVILCMGFGR